MRLFDGSYVEGACRHFDLLVCSGIKMVGSVVLLNTNKAFVTFRIFNNGKNEGEFIRFSVDVSFELITSQLIQQKVLELYPESFI